jgi:hypothetical protein
MSNKCAYYFASTVCHLFGRYDVFRETTTTVNTWDRRSLHSPIMG